MTRDDEVDRDESSLFFFQPSGNSLLELTKMTRDDEVDPDESSLFFLPSGNSLLELTKMTRDDDVDPDESDLLSRNLGPDIIVVITKTDTMTQLGTMDKKYGNSTIYFNIVFSWF